MEEEEQETKSQIVLVNARMTDRHAAAQQAVSEFEVDGWKGNVEDAMNPLRRVGHGPLTPEDTLQDGVIGDAYSVRFRRPRADIKHIVGDTEYTFKVTAVTDGFGSVAYMANPSNHAASKACSTCLGVEKLKSGSWRDLISFTLHVCQYSVEDRFSLHPVHEAINAHVTASRKTIDKVLLDLQEQSRASTDPFQVALALASLRGAEVLANELLKLWGDAMARPRAQTQPSRTIDDELFYERWTNAMADTALEADDRGDHPRGEGAGYGCD